ncbi:MAG: hypothetical protein CM1200mP35_06030 [Chloroflexota bacterium]|nr:MAG: hypothetical protein CM1200mP35_06030 [Chloroflexota bacterium]
MWIGNFFANGAQWLQLLSVGWLVQHLTQGTTSSALLVITIGAINTLPSLFVSPWGGVLGDRLDRRKLVMSLQLFMTCMAFFFAFLILLDWIKGMACICVRINFRRLSVIDTTLASGTGREYRSARSNREPLCDQCLPNNRDSFNWPVLRGYFNSLPRVFLEFHG